MDTAMTVITSSLKEANITDQVIAGLKENFLPIVINGIDDKEGLEKAKLAKKECADWRILATKICKKGREESNAVSKAWIKKENEVVGEIEKVEKHLADQIEAVSAEQERLAFEAMVRPQIPERLAKLASIGIEDVTEAELLTMSMGDFVGYFNNLNSEYLTRKQKEQDEKGAEQRKEQERIEQEKKDLIHARSLGRMKELTAMGMRGSAFDYVYANLRVTDKQVEESSEAEWKDLIAFIEPLVIAGKKEQEKQAERDIEAGKEKAREDARLAEINRQERERLQKEEDDKKEKARLAAEAAAAPDKDKLSTYADMLLSVYPPALETLATDEAKAKLAEARTLLEKIVAILK